MRIQRVSNLGVRFHDSCVKKPDKKLLRADVAVLAITSCPAIGVDVEWIHEFSEIDASATVILSSVELKKFASRDSSRRVDSFFRAWTRKEALLKGVGSSLLRDSKTISFEYTGYEEFIYTRHVDQPYNREWCVRPIFLQSGYCSAIAINDRTFRNRIKIEAWNTP